MSPGLPRPRPLPVIAILASATTLAAAIWIGARQGVGGLRARAVQESNALLDGRHERPIHRASEAGSEAGSFGEVAGRQIPMIEAAIRPWIDDGVRLQAARDVAAGARTSSDLPMEVRVSLAKARPALLALLAATRAPLGQLPREWLREETGTSREVVQFQVAGLMTAIEIRRALAEQREADAVTLCLDGLALGRDAAVGEVGVIGTAVAAAIVTRLTPACAEALSTAQAGVTPGVPSAIRAVRDALPAYADVLRAELICSEMLAFTSLLVDVRGELGPRGRACLSHETYKQPWELLLLRDAWHGVRATDDAWIAAARLEGVDRLRAFEEVRRSSLRSLNPIARGTANWGKYAGHADATLVRLDALVAIAAAADLRRRTGRWPSSLSELGSAGGLTPTETSRLRQASLTLRDDGFTIRLALPHSQQGDAASLELTAHSH